MEWYYDTFREIQRSLLFQWIWDLMDQEIQSEDQEILREVTKGSFMVVKVDYVWIRTCILRVGHNEKKFKNTQSSFINPNLALIYHFTDYWLWIIQFYIRAKNTIFQQVCLSKFQTNFNTSVKPFNKKIDHTEVGGVNNSVWDGHRDSEMVKVYHNLRVTRQMSPVVIRDSGIFLGVQFNYFSCQHTTELHNRIVHTVSWLYCQFFSISIFRQLWNIQFWLLCVQFLRYFVYMRITIQYRTHIEDTNSWRGLWHWDFQLSFFFEFELLRILLWTEWPSSIFFKFVSY